MAFTFGGKSTAGAEEESSASESDDAAQDVLDALETKDAKALNLALKRHYELCASGADEEDDEEEA